MTYPLGLSTHWAELFGKPHLGGMYTGSGYRRTRERCPLCGGFATNCHHMVPRGVASEMPLVTEAGSWALRSPLMSLCGSGTTGCHGRFHNRLLTIEWEWYRPSFRDLWWAGDLLVRHGEHSPALFRYGCYAIRDESTGTVLRIRSDR